MNRKFFKHINTEIISIDSSAEALRRDGIHEISFIKDDAVSTCSSITQRTLLTTLPRSSSSVFDRLAIRETIASSLNKKNKTSTFLKSHQNHHHPSLPLTTVAAYKTNGRNLNVFERIATAETFASAARKVKSNTYHSSGVDRKSSPFNSSKHRKLDETDSEIRHNDSESTIENMNGFRTSSE